LASAVPFKLVPLHGYGVGQAFVPLLQELLEPTFRNLMSECRWFCRIAGVFWKWCSYSCDFILGNKKNLWEPH